MPMLSIWIEPHFNKNLLNHIYVREKDGTQAVRENSFCDLTILLPYITLLLLISVSIQARDLVLGNRTASVCSLTVLLILVTKLYFLSMYTLLLVDNPNLTQQLNDMVTDGGVNSVFNTRKIDHR